MIIIIRFAAFYNVSWQDLEIMAVLVQPKYSNQTVLQITPNLLNELKQLELLIQSHEVRDKKKPIKYEEFRIAGGNINYFFDAFKVYS
uniref:Transcriptional regulator n=1 Tax=Elaeophora elaphi TaxID=1147741 RepID=A0A0R3RMX5_9BILA